MRPLDFYRLGVRLANLATTEAEQRNAIGRLYYGLHHEACCRYFRENPAAPPLRRGARHKQLTDRYDALPFSPPRRIRRLLKQLSGMRNVCDYELAAPIRYRHRERSAAEMMRMATTVAEGLLIALEDFSPGEAEDGCRCPVH